ncbi:MAG TPA: signal peptidase I [Streptosporangiaceae bacterium]|nr:signal peptidase I [Streptosporangiaceae bacterium]
MTQQIATWAPPAQPHSRRVGRIVFWVLVGLALAVLVTSVAIPVATIQPYLEQSTSMRPTLAPGDRILAVEGSSGIRRGDIAVLRVPASVSGTDDLFVKRVIGLPGDHVACCNARGQVTVDGRALSENYLYPGDRPSRTTFSVTVGKGEIWVMGDDRNISVDSRKWGPVPLSGVVGRVILVAHGSSFATVRTPLTFVAVGLEPMDTRLGLYVRLAIAAAASLVLLLLLAIFGIARFVIRRRRRIRGAPPGGPAPPAISGPLVQPLYGVYRVPMDDSEAKPRPTSAEIPRPADAAEEPRPAQTDEQPPPAQTEEKPRPAEATGSSGAGNPVSNG